MVIIVNDKKYLTVAEFAKIKGISKQSVYNSLYLELKPFVEIINGRKMLHISALGDTKGEAAAEKEPLQAAEPREPAAPEQAQRENDTAIAGSVWLAQLEEKDKQIERLQQELAESRRQINECMEHSREQERKLIELLERSQELQRNNQILLAQQLQQKELKEAAEPEPEQPQRPQPESEEKQVIEQPERQEPKERQPQPIQKTTAKVSAQKNKRKNSFLRNLFGR